MTLRLTALLALTALAGCDSAGPDSPDTFEAAFQGVSRQSVTGSYRYTRLSRYTGIGTGNSYAIYLQTADVEPWGYGFTPLPDSVVSIYLYFDRAEAPSGTYQIEGQPWAGAGFWVDGRRYSVHAGTVTVTRERGRLVGTFQFTDTFHLAENSDPSEVQVEGRFDIAPSNPTDVQP